MVNNKQLIIPLLQFPHKDIFYFVQILERKKDHPLGGITGANNNSRLIKAYFITSIEKLEKQWDEMVKLAEVFEARVMINLNPRNFRKAGFHLLQKIANSMSNDDFYNLHRAFTSVCGEYHAEIDKRWIVDIDKEDLDKLDEIQAFIQAEHDKINKKDYNILSILPTRSGKHIITNPFNAENFGKTFPGIEYHKNNPTNLYIP